MTSFSSKSIRLALLAAAGGLGFGVVPAGAQPVNYVYGSTQPKEDPGADLSRHLRSLADSPRSLTALMGAGKAALALGDPQAAITFFARAEEVAPRDGRIKAGIGSALLQMEQAPGALKFFSEATSLGVADAEIARDRGLAYDLSGNPARAQLDYALVLRKGEDPEVRRRMALSMAISGDREGALKMIDAQVRKQDRAAWRTRAFVLALTGDAAEATKAVEAVMPAQAAAMRPFFARLPALAPAQRAMAVHFGHFPRDGQAIPVADADQGTQFASMSPSVTAAGRPDSAQATLGRPRNPPAEPVSTAARRRPGAAEPAIEDVNTRVRSSRTQVAATRAAATPPEPRPAAPAQVQPKAATSSGPIRDSAVASARTAPPPAVAADKPPVALASLPPSTAADGEGATDRVEVAGPADSPAEAETSSFADVAAAIAALPDSIKPNASTTPPITAEKPTVLAKAEVAKPAAVKEEAAKPAAKKAEPAKKSTTKKAAAAKKAEPKDPSRHWVQIAGGADKAAMGREFARLRGKAPKLLSDQSAWTTPLNATNRLLVGPFKSAGEAQDFVNELAAAELSAFSWTSPAGQEIEKLAAK